MRRDGGDVLRTAFGWALIAAGVVAVGMSMGGLSRGGMRPPVVMLGVVIIPANRLRSIFVFLGLAVFLAFYLLFRLMRPERLVDPEVFATALIYLKALRSPAPPYLPSTWAFDGLRFFLLNEGKEIKTMAIL